MGAANRLSLHGCCIDSEFAKHLRHGSTSPGALSRSDQSGLLEFVIFDDELADGAGDVTVLVEIARA